MEEKGTSFDLILKCLRQKAPLKVDVTHKTESAFELLKTTLKQLETELQESMSAIDKRVVIKYTERSLFDLEFRISDDILIFTMHTDVFTFPDDHPVWNLSYLKEDKMRSYCGMISVYNFLTDSLKYNRVNDTGVLIARILINSENHFLVEGKRQLGILFNDFESDAINPERVRALSETAILYTLHFDIYTPPFDRVKVISVQELIEKNMASVISTGKRLGFRFQSDTDVS